MILYTMLGCPFHFRGEAALLAGGGGHGVHFLFYQVACLNWHCSSDGDQFLHDFVPRFVLARCP